MTSFVIHSIELIGDPEDIAVAKIMLGMPERARSIDFDPVAAAREIHNQESESVSEFSKAGFSLFNIDSPRGEELTLYALSESGLSNDNYSRDWQIEHWGVMARRFEGYLVEESLGRLEYSVRSGWDSPVGALYTLSTLFPAVMIKVEWWSENFEWGRFTLLSGVETFQETYGFSERPFVDREPILG